jgi:hypothetical protein
VSGGILGFVAGSLVGSLVPAWLGYEVDDLVAFVVFGGLGIVIGALRPPRVGRLAGPELPRAEAGLPTPVGALGAEFARALEGPTASALMIGAVVALMAVPVGWVVYLATGITPSLLVLGIVAVGGFVACLAIIAFLPAFLLPPATRTAMVVEVWLGAREFARIFGSRRPLGDIPIRPDEVGPWLASQPETPESLEGRVELLMMANEFEAARAALDRMPDQTPPERYRRAVLASTLRYQVSGEVDDSEARTIAEAMPPGADRVEALAGLAIFEARRRLPGNDWREPLLAVRGQIPEGDTRILLRDNGRAGFELLLRKTWPVLALIVGVVVWVIVASAIA